MFWVSTHAVDGSKGVKRKWLLGDTTVRSRFLLMFRANWNPPQPLPNTTIFSLDPVTGDDSEAAALKTALVRNIFDAKFVCVD